jgi:CRISPR/Cas system-associated exonuclease Cas4 (RecB family)
MEIEHISVSRAKLFNECPVKYKFQYHLRIPSPYPEPFYFAYGKIVHKIAETFVEERGVRSLNEIKADVLDGRIEIEPGKTAPKLPPDYAARLPEHIRSIQKLTERIGTDGILEHKFKYDLDPPNGKYVTGFIDRLIHLNGSVWILDYKTTKKGPFRETPETIKYDPQLRLYARVAQKDTGVSADKIKCALYYVEGGDLLPVVYSQESLDSIEPYMLGVYNQILDADADRVRGKTGPHCKRCDYREICPFYQSSGGRADVWDGDMSGLVGGD